MGDLKQTRRGILTLTGALTLTGIGLSTAENALSQETETPSDSANSVTFGVINNEGEWLVLHNEGDDAADISGLRIDFEFDQPEDQTKEFRDAFGVTAIPAGGSITVSTGAPSSEDGNSIDNPDVEFDYSTAKMADDGSDTYAILSAADDVIARSDQDHHRTGEEETDTTPDSDEEGPDVDLPKTYHANLRGGVQPQCVETNASGEATFEVDEDGTEVSYVVTVADISNVTQAHIHLGDEGESGPVVAWLYPEEGREPQLIEGETSGTLADGVITEDDLVGEWEEVDFGDVIATFENEGTYVNVHTEQHPAGQIRGQITPGNE